jgi:hypothetical protein
MSPPDAENSSVSIRIGFVYAPATAWSCRLPVELRDTGALRPRPSLKALSTSLKLRLTRRAAAVRSVLRRFAAIAYFLNDWMRSCAERPSRETRSSPMPNGNWAVARACG